MHLSFPHPLTPPPATSPSARSQAGVRAHPTSLAVTPSCEVKSRARFEWTEVLACKSLAAGHHPARPARWTLPRGGEVRRKGGHRLRRGAGAGETGPQRGGTCTAPSPGGRPRVRGAGRECERRCVCGAPCRCASSPRPARDPDAARSLQLGTFRRRGGSERGAFPEFGGTTGRRYFLFLVLR